MKTTRRKFQPCWLLVLLALLAPTVSASAQGNRRAQLDLQIGNVNWQGQQGNHYDVFDDITYRHTVRFRVLKLEGPATRYFVTFSKDSPGDEPRQMRGGFQPLNYQIHDTPQLSNILKDLPLAREQEVIAGRFNAKESVQDHEFTVVLPARQVLYPGRYSDRIRVTLYEGTMKNYTEIESRTISVSAQVEQSADVALLDPGAPFDAGAITRSLDFGELESGERLACDLRVRGNTPFRVTMESRQGGVLRNTGPGVDSTVPYSLRVNGRDIALPQNQPALVAWRFWFTGPDGASYPVEVTIGSTDNAAAGNYEDELTITLITN